MSPSEPARGAGERAAAAPKLLAVLGLVLVPITVFLMGSDRTQWSEGSTEGDWVVAFTGHGEVRGGQGSVTLRPQQSQRPEETHAALVHSVDEYDDTDLAATVTTTQQLRIRSEPNAWEVGWLLWRYADPQHFYALALKPNGWEISKEDPQYPGAQRFLDSGGSPVFPIGSTHRVRIRMLDDTIWVFVDGEFLAKTVDDENPYKSGRVGLYSEDAEVIFSRVVVRTPQHLDHKKGQR